MIEVENTAAFGFSAAIRGMRNPLASWDKSDSYRDENGEFVVGEADLALMCKLCQAGPEHRKFMRQITVSMDITAPLYWWKEYDTYKVGTVADSCSTMHTIHKREFTLDDFSTEHLSESGIDCLNGIIEVLNAARNAYVNYDALNEEYKNITDLWGKGITCKKRPVVANDPAPAQQLQPKKNRYFQLRKRLGNDPSADRTQARRVEEIRGRAERSSFYAGTDRRRQTMNKTKAADKARRIAENLSGYAADFYGQERRIRNGQAYRTDVTYEIEALVEELESLIDELQ